MAGSDSIRRCETGNNCCCDADADSNPEACGYSDSCSKHNRPGSDTYRDTNADANTDAASDCGYSRGDSAASCPKRIACRHPAARSPDC